MPGRIASFFRNLLRKRAAEQALDDELQSAVELLTQEKMKEGLSHPAARRQALIALGGIEQVKEHVREARIGNWLHSVMSDCRYGARQLRKNPGFTLVAVITLAAAIGANAVVFSILNALILNPLHVPHADSLYAIQRGNEASLAQSYPDYLDLRDRNRTLEALAASNGAQVGLDTGENPSRAWISEVSGNFFDVLGVQPYLGRMIHESDEHGPNSAPYIVLSYPYWKNHFASDRGAVGRVVQVNKHPFTIVGVAPPDFHGTLVFFNPDFYLPIVHVEQLESQKLNDRKRRWVFMTFGHLKPGVTLAQAVADLNSIGAYLEKTYPKDEDKRTFTLARPSLYGDYLGRPTRAFLSALMLLAGMILIAACANLGSLFAARAADRSREVALRLALGASRSRVLRQLFTEALLLSVMGGVAGISGSVMLLRALSVWQPFSRWPIYLEVTPDVNVYGVAVLLTFASGFLFGAVPVRQVLHTDPYEIVKSGSLGSVGRRMNVRDLVLVVEIAICAVLVTSSLVAVRGLLRSLQSNFGFDPQNAVVADTDLQMAGYGGDSAIEMQKRMIDALQKIPGVSSVGLINAAPLASGGFTGAMAFTDETTDLRPGNAAVPNAYMFSISPEYFEAARTPLLSGRAFSWHDDENAPFVAVVNQEFARMVFGSEDKAMGRYFKKRDATRIQVVGIVGDGKYNLVTEAQEPAMFVPILQSPSTQAYFVVRSNVDAGQVVSAIRNTVRDLDASLPLYIEPWAEAMQAPLFGARMAAWSLGVLGAMGGILSITGIFGMAAYAVSKRLRELGIRMALGAQRTEMLGAALGRAIKLLAFGSAAGLVLGILASRVLAAIVYQATSRDPLVLAGVALAMGLLGLLATWIPAQRALSIDPANLLREQ